MSFFLALMMMLGLIKAPQPPDCFYDKNGVRYCQPAPNPPAIAR